MEILINYLIIGMLIGLATVGGLLATCWICFSIKTLVRKSLNVSLFFALCLFDSVYIYPVAHDLILRLL
ncbi:hypothetical protein COPG_00018 [Colwellia phage 9A]|uniref:Uncharacterized protein n=1 Tax=Colwellia phage 9A TaxID=765765 RepID=I3UM99_9CAUD|nr:hypothetical protein COPG_00018 [Colwellia phage 9A]AFK66614.1 hypothetical protein COPG_00018 [Colwellia phage 9A]